MSKNVNRQKLSANAKARKRDANGRFAYEGGSKKKATPKATSGDKATPKVKSKTAKDDLAKIDKVKPNATRGQKSRLVKKAAKAREENDYRNLTDLGEKVVGKQALKDLEDSYKAYKKKADKRVQQLRDTWDKYDRALKSEDFEAAEKLLNKFKKLKDKKDLELSWKTVETRANTILKKLHGEPRKDVAAKISAGNRLQNKREVAKNAADFFGLSEGKGSNSLRTIDTRQERAYMVPSTGLLNTGVYETPEKRRIFLYHEMGHFVEIDNPKTKRRIVDWIDKRTEGEVAQKMSVITGNPNYRDDEVAKPDKFFNPYVGKRYDNGDTEALSTGVQHFADPKSLMELISKDREHFLLTVGALKAND